MSGCSPVATAGTASSYLVCGWHVLVTVRSPDRTRLHDLVDGHGASTGIETVDVTMPAQIAGLRRRLASSTFDLLFVHPGVTNQPEGTVAENERARALMHGFVDASSRRRDRAKPSGSGSVQPGARSSSGCARGR